MIIIMSLQIPIIIIIHRNDGDHPQIFVMIDMDYTYL